MDWATLIFEVHPVLAAIWVGSLLLHCCLYSQPRSHRLTIPLIVFALVEAANVWVRFTLDGGGSSFYGVWSKNIPQLFALTYPILVIPTAIALFVAMLLVELLQRGRRALNIR